MSGAALAGAVGAAVVATVAAVGVFGAPGGAQTGEPVVAPIEHAGLDRSPRLSDDGRVVVFESTSVDATGVETTHVAVFDTTLDPAATTLLSAGLGDPNGHAPAISGDGCLVVWSTVVPAPETAPAQAQGASEAPGGVVDFAPPEDDPTETPVPSPDDPPDDGEKPPPAEEPEPAPEPEPEPAPEEEPPPEEPGDEVELRAWDRCDDVPATVSTPILPAPVVRQGPFPPPALSVDGDVIAFSTGDDVVRLAAVAGSTQTGPATYVETDRFDVSPTPTPEAVVGPIVDVTDDGRRIVFTAAVDPTPGDPDDPVPFAVREWIAGDAVEPPALVELAAGAIHPSISGDGDLVAYQLAGASPEAQGVAVLVRTLAPTETAPVPDRVVVVDPTGRRPVASGDGVHVGYLTPAGVGLASWNGDAPPFDPAGGLVISRLARAGVDDLAPAVSRHGSVVAVSDLPVEGAADGDVVRWSLAPVFGFDLPSYDLGQGDVGEVLSRVVSVRNDGPATLPLPLGALEVAPPFTIATGCEGLLRPGTTCNLTVELAIVAYEDVFGEISVTSPDGVRASAELFGLGARPTTTTVATATTQPRNTTVTTSRPRTTIRPPQQTTPRVTVRPTTATTRPTTATTTTTTVPSPPTVTPADFDFAPTIVDAGRRTARFDVADPTLGGRDVSAVAIDPAGSEFAVAGTDCTGASLAAGASCTVDVDFAPTTEGERTAELVIDFGDGTTVRARLGGVGAPPPTLEVVPGVAGAGQVVTVVGGGFPAGADVELRIGTTTPRTVVVNDAGALNVPTVILPTTQPGPIVVLVPGQVDVFDDVTTELLVGNSGDRSDPAVFGRGGVGVSVGG